MFDNKGVKQCFYCGDDTVVGQRIDENTAQWENVCKECATEHERMDLFGGYEKQVALYVGEAASEPKQFLEINGSHNDGYMVSASQYENGLGSFLDEYIR